MRLLRHLSNAMVAFTAFKHIPPKRNHVAIGFKLKQIVQNFILLAYYFLRQASPHRLLANKAIAQAGSGTSMLSATAGPVATSSPVV